MKKTIEDFLNNQVRDYSLHVLLERAIPSIIDGLKPSARQVIYTASKEAKSFTKTAAFIGKIFTVGGYSKGDGALPGVIAGLVQDYIGANDVPFLRGSGEFGSRKYPDGDAAPRYTKVAIHPNFQKYFIDLELTESREEDGKFYEPEFFLPSIPTILLNRNSGIAPGFKCLFHPYNPKDIIKNIKRLLDEKKQKEMVPHYGGYKGKVHKMDDKWQMDGVHEVLGNDSIVISEIPVSVSREAFIKNLNDMLNDKIISYEEGGTEDYLFTIQCTKGQMATLQKLSEEKFLKLFKLRTTLTEILNAVTEDNKLIQFDNPLEIIEYFVQYRMTVLTKRKEYFIKKNNDLIPELEEKIKFIGDVVSESFSVSKLISKDDLRKRITEGNYGYVEKLIQMPLYNLTTAEITRLKENLSLSIKELVFYEDVTEKELYLEDLKCLG